MKFLFCAKTVVSALCLVLFAVVPFAAFAQTQTDVVIEGVFDGQDSLVFEGNTIRLKHISYAEPTGVTVNGKPWEDLSKPFELGFTPDFAKAAVVEKKGRGNVSLTVNSDRLVLVVDDSEGGDASYRVRIGETDQPDRKLPEVQLFSVFLDKVEPGTVVITGDIDLGHFQFQSNTILFRRVQRGEHPMNICVNGISWDLGKPFELDFTPDFEHAVIIDTGERDDVIMSPHKESIDLTIGRYNGRDNKRIPTRVTISMDGKAYREIMSAEKKPAGKPKDYGPGIVVLEGSVDDVRNMVFRGDKIYSKENKDKKKNQIASGIPVDRFSVNDVEWEDFDTPFELGFVPDFTSAKIVEKEGRGLIEFVAGKNEAELEIRDNGNRNGLYRVVLSMKKTEDGNQVADKPATTAPSGKTVSDGTSTGKTASAKQPEERFTVVLEGTLKGDGKFQFHSDTVEYWPQPLNANYYPSDVTVNGKPWETPDKGRTFFLDFVTDYMSGKIERVTGARATWKVSPMLSQSILDPFDKSVGELSVTGNGQPFRIELSFANYRQDYMSKIVSMKDETREKNQIASLERAYAANKGQLSLTQRKAVEQYREERMQERNLWLRDPDYTTDGKELPPVGWASSPVSRKPFPDQFDITIEATVNVVAQFAFQGNRIVYRDSSHPNDGKYPSQVKINGKPWKNLHLPFKLDSAIDQDSILGTEIETEFYRYTLHPEGEWTALTILNHGVRDEEPVKIKLTVLKSKKPYDDSVIYSGGVPLPAEVITNPEAFENFWKNAMRGGNSGAGRPQSGQPANQPGAATQPGAPATDNSGR